MNKYTPILVALSSTLLAISSAQAQSQQDAQKIAIIKGLYAEYRKAEPSLNKNIFSSDFNAALAHDAKAAKADGIACLDYDYIVQGQDYDAKEINRTLKIQAAANGRMKVSFRNFNEARSLYYVFRCDERGCVIDDIIEPEGSFKQQLRQCLRKQYPHVTPRW